LRPLRIAQVCTLGYPLHQAGGVERMVSLLTRELMRRGHELTVFASGDSQTDARLVAVVPENLRDRQARGDAIEEANYDQLNFSAALERSEEFDIIHCHSGWTLAYHSCNHTPVLHTLHGILTVDDLFQINHLPDRAIVAATQQQVARLDPARRATIPVIHHGCDFDFYRLETEPEDYLLSMGIIHPGKNPLDAIHIAVASGRRILIAGQPDREQARTYLRDSILPLVDGERVVYLGGVPPSRGRELLAKAAALLYPVQWEEAFGQVMIEAMACGTPVLGYRRGPVPEVVDHGITGLYGASIDELVPLLPAVLELDRAKVREHARTRFSHHRMADEYEALYASLLA
jgi:glycosyltransferase involved in cell wall biosynthesis